MPLLPGKSKKAKEHNLQIELEAGQPLKRALATMYNKAGESKSKKKKRKK